MRFLPDLLVGVAAGSDVVADPGYDYATVLDAIIASCSIPHIPALKQERIQRSVEPAFYT